MTRLMGLQLLVLASAFTALSAHAKVGGQTLEYKEGKTTLEGFLAVNEEQQGRRPAVLVVHNWMGIGAETKERTQQLAEMGYVAFAADIYGKGVRPADAKEAGALAGRYKSDRALMRKRIRAAYDQLRKNPKVDPQKIAILGYCFGGTVALELARSGTDVVGAVSFHGGLESPTPADAKKIKGRVLVLHGADDPFVSDTEVAGFEKEMRDAKVDWQLVKYSNAVHSFTEKAAGNDNSKGAAYNELADRRSWIALRNFLEESFQSPTKKM